MILALAGLVALSACGPAPAPNEKVLRVVPSSDLGILDPVFTTTDITRNHGYMIYDTLFGMHAGGRISPQRVDTYDTTADQKTWTFTLRDGLEFHDGKPVTSEDVVASLQRWAQIDQSGQKLLSLVKSWEVVNPKTFRIVLNAPWGLMLDSLAKPASYIAFIMPRRVAATPYDKEIDDYTGSGPFIFKKDETKPGEKVVYVRNPKYKPRAEAASGTAGGKVVKVDRVEWIIIKDSQTQANALSAGEVDLIDEPAYELYPSFKSNPDIRMVETNLLGGRLTLRFNHLQSPFNDPKIRLAAMAAMNQPAFLQTQIGDPEMYRTCFSVYSCNTTYATTAGMDFISKPDLKHAQQLLKESNYDGTPVILLHQTDVAREARLAGVAKQLLTQAGFNVDMQSMDRQTLVSRRDRKDGWNAFLFASSSVSALSPFYANTLNAACSKAWVGWPCDPELEKLRDAFALAGTDAARKALAEQIQVRAMQIGAQVPLGQFVIKTAARTNITGFVPGFFTVYWNVEKQ
jgi:peptide/nickel transport system substrate-binding protein